MTSTESHVDPTLEVEPVNAAATTAEESQQQPEEPPTTTTTTTATEQPSSNRAAILRVHLEDLRRQIAQRKSRQEELEKVVALYPPRDDVTAEHERVEAQLQQTRDTLEKVTGELESLRPSEERAYQLCTRLHRLERYAERAEEWASTQFAAQVEADVAKEAEEADSQIAAFVESLQVRREDVLQRMGALRQRIRERAAELRRGHHPQPRTMHNGAFAVTATPQAEGMERCASPRVTEEDLLLDDDSLDLRHFNKALGGELHDLVDRLRRLQKLRSKFQSESMKARNDAKKELFMLENLVRQTEQRFARDQRMIQQLHSSNAALTSTLQLVMGQLNVEHYGTHGGPASIEAQQKSVGLLTGRSRSASAAPAGNSPSKLTNGTSPKRDEQKK